MHTRAARPEGGAVRVEGAAAPNARVRIATPRGEPVMAQADAQGRWRALLTASQPVHLFGLSMSLETIQARNSGDSNSAYNGGAASAAVLLH